MQNDLENIPFALVFMWGTALAILGAALTPLNNTSDLCTAHVVLATIFTVTRVTHSIIYILQLPLSRGGVFIIGTTALFGMGIVGIVAAFEMTI